MKHKVSRIAGAVIVLTNIGYFIPLTIQALKSGGGGFGYGLMLLPVTIMTHILMIPAMLSLINKVKNQNGLLVTNLLGTLWILFWMISFLSTPGKA